MKSTKKNSKPTAEENGTTDSAQPSEGKTAHDQAQDDAVQRMVARFTTKQEEKEVDKLFLSLIHI